MREFTLADYAAMDAKSLTLQDALDDATFQHKHAKDKERFFALSPEMVRTLTELDKAEDKAQFLDAVNAYFNDGEDVLHNGRLKGLSAFTRSTVRQAIEAHEGRIGSKVVKDYMSFVTGKQGAYKRYVASTSTTEDDTF